MYIVLSCFHLNKIGRSAHQAGFNGACQHSPQEDNVGIQKNFFPCFWLSKKTKIFLYKCFAYTIWEIEFTVWPGSSRDGPKSSAAQSVVLNYSCYCGLKSRWEYLFLLFPKKKLCIKGLIFGLTLFWISISTMQTQKREQIDAFNCRIVYCMFDWYIFKMSKH